jgi:hypothetical protein
MKGCGACAAWLLCMCWLPVPPAAEMAEDYIKRAAGAAKLMDPEPLLLYHFHSAPAVPLLCTLPWLHACTAELLTPLNPRHRNKRGELEAQAKFLLAVDDIFDLEGLEVGGLFCAALCCSVLDCSVLCCAVMWYMMAYLACRWGPRLLRGCCCVPAAWLLRGWSSRQHLSAGSHSRGQGSWQRWCHHEQQGSLGAAGSRTLHQ